MKYIFAAVAVVILFSNSLQADLQKNLVVLSRSLNQLGSSLVISKPDSSQQEAQKRAEEEAKKAQEEAQKRAEEEAKKAQEEAQKRAEEEAKKAQEEAQKRAEEEAKKAQEEAQQKPKELLVASIQSLINSYEARSISDSDFEKLKAELMAYFNIILEQPPLADENPTNWTKIGADQAIIDFLKKDVVSENEFDEIVEGFNDWGTSGYSDALKTIEQRVKELKKPA